MNHRPGVLLIVVAALATATSSTSAAAYDSGGDYFSFQDTQIKESSGVVASSYRDGVYYTHNDSDSAPQLFAVDDQGCTLTRYALLGADGGALTPWRDPEDIARGPLGGVSTLWIGDIGDNLHERGGEVFVYALAEPKANASTHGQSVGCPTPAEESVAVTTYTLKYPDVAHDAETLLADPITGQLFIVTKAPTGESQVYAAPATLVAGEVNDLSFVTEIVFPPSTTYDRTPEQILAAGPQQLGFDAAGRLWAVGGDISPEGGRLVIRTYTDAFEWAIEDDRDLRAALLVVPTKIPLRYERQGEAITYTRDGASLVTTCEDVGCTAHIYAAD